MKTFLKIALGCLIVPVVLAIVLIIAAIAVRRAAPTVHRDERADLAQPVEAVTEAQLSAEGLNVATAPPVGRALPVELVLEEGNFTLEAGPAGSGIRVEGDYDAGVYDLKQEMTKDASGQPRYRLSFRPRYSMLHRLLSEGGVHIGEDDNRITVHLPRGLPMTVDARISKGSSHLALGGLSLQSARLDLSMGEHVLTVEEPNPLEMSRLEVNAAMGESRLGDLANLRAAEIEMWGRMGEVRVDFGEKLARDTKLVARMRMGEMSLHLPDEARVKARHSSFLAGSSGLPRNDQSSSGFLLDVDSSASFGEVKYRRD